MYLSNTDRERLGIREYGSDVPDDVVAAAEAALAPVVEKPSRRKATADEAGQ